MLSKIFLARARVNKNCRAVGESLACKPQETDSILPPELPDPRLAWVGVTL